MSADQNSSAPSQSAGGPVGLAGWLILPLFGLAICPIATVLIGMSEVPGIAESWSYLTFIQKSSVAFLALILVVSLFVVPIVLLVLAFKRLEIFPGLFIVWIWAGPVAIVAATFVALLPFREVVSFGEAFGGDYYRDIAQAVIYATIWTLYMNRSRRVQNTFIN